MCVAAKIPTAPPRPHRALPLPSSPPSPYPPPKDPALAEPSGAVERFLYALASRFVVFTTTGLACGLLTLRNEVELTNAEALHRHVLARPPGVALITVANHNSVLDDPGLLALLLPWAARTTPERLRWSICTEEICFADAFPSTWFSLGKAIPVQRGGSLYQKGLAALQEKVNGGAWAQVFAEGRCWQEGGTPLRDSQGRWCTASGRCGPPGQKLGALKWGVGKLIANAPVAPIVLPFFHMGMPDVVPQDSGNSVVTWDLFSGALLSAEVGQPVDVADLVGAYVAGAKARARGRNAARQARLRSLAGDAAAAAAAAAAEAAAAAAAPAAPSAPAAPPPQPLPHLVDAESCSLREAARELHARLQAAAGSSRQAGLAACAAARADAAAAAAATAASPLAAQDSFHRPAPTPTRLQRKEGQADPVLGLLGEQQGQGQGAVVMRVAKRQLPSGRGGTCAYNEAPLRIAPPDAEFLSLAEAVEEETARLGLYSQIASRLEGELAALERSVMARRAARGWVERETYGQRQRREALEGGAGSR